MDGLIDRPAFTQIEVMFTGLPSAVSCRASDSTAAAPAPIAVANESASVQAWGDSPRGVTLMTKDSEARALLDATVTSNRATFPGTSPRKTSRGAAVSIVPADSWLPSESGAMAA